MKLVYPAIFYKFEQGDGYVVEFPDLPGCVTQGYCLEEAMEMAIDAASGWILESIEEDETIPSPSARIDLTKYEGASFSNLIMLDMDEYAKLYGDKAVKKTLSLPRWLNTLAEKENLNFSHILQQALKKELHLDYSLSFEETKTIEQFTCNLMEQIEGLLPKQEQPLTTDKTSTQTDVTGVCLLLPSFVGGNGYDKR